MMKVDKMQLRKFTFKVLSLCVCIYIYIYIYRERENGTEVTRHSVAT